MSPLTYRFPLFVGISSSGLIMKTELFLFLDSFHSFCDLTSGLVLLSFSLPLFFSRVCFHLFFFTIVLISIFLALWLYVLKI